MLFDSRIRDKLRAKRDISTRGHLHRSRNRDFDLRFECMRCLAKDQYIGIPRTAILELLYIDIKRHKFQCYFLQVCSRLFVALERRKELTFLT